MIRKIRFKSIRTSMIIYFSCLVLLIVTAFMFFSIKYTKENLMENSEENSRRLIEQVNLSIENYVDHMENISHVVVSNRDMREYLFGDDETGVWPHLKEEFQTILQVRKDIYNIAILGNNGRYFINGGNRAMNTRAQLEKKEWYREAKEAGSEIVISSSHVQNLVKGDYKWVVTLSRGIQNPKTQKVEGLFILDLNYDVINDLCESIHLGNKGYVYIVDQKGEIVYHPQQQLILSGVKNELLKEVLNQKTGISYKDENGENKIYTTFRSGKTGWTIVGVVYTSELVKREQAMRAMYIGMALALIVLAGVIAIFLSDSITKPIKQLQAGMKKVQEGRFQPVYIDAGGDNEIASLNRSFNRMTEHIDELMKRNMAEQVEKRKSELKALQSQINPHFLYNTLDSIIWMIETDDSQQAIKMTSILARFFRQAIGNSDVFVTISQELEYTKNYLLIQQMRYRDKVTFDIQVNPDILECHIIKLVMQPLVENALYHGLKYKEGGGHIWITGYRLENKVILKVMDDGIGMDTETLQNLFRNKNKTGGKHNGVGLGNIQNRLKLYYGEEYGIQVDSEREIGTAITIEIPFLLPEIKEETDEKA